MLIFVKEFIIAAKNHKTHSPMRWQATTGPGSYHFYNQIRQVLKYYVKTTKMHCVEELGNTMISLYQDWAINLARRPLCEGPYLLIWS